MNFGLKVVAGTATALTIGGFALPAFAAETPVYVESANSSVELATLATSGDKFGNYVLPGIPDGTGAFQTGSTLNILMNTEQGYNTTSASLVRANGTSYGSTVSRLTMDIGTRKITSVSDFIKKVTYFDYATGTWGSVPGAPTGALKADAYGTPLHTNYIARFCSASLSPAGRLAFKSGTKTYGIKDAVFLNGEETGDEGRAFATSGSGDMVQIPKLGLGAFETFNVVPTGSLTTAVIGNEDGSATESQLTMYVGKKTATGAWYNKAGLTNGKNYVMKIGSLASEADFRAYVGKGKESDVSFVETSTSINGVAQNQDKQLKGTALSRVEDGAFDPNNPRDYYFVTTESNKNAKATASDPATPTVKRDGGALWRLRFNDVKNPLKGASLTMLLDGSEAPYLNKPDNIEVDGYGNILIQEDPGNSVLRTRMFAYRIADAKFAILSQFKAQYFEPGAAQFITQDEESSGVLNVTNFLKKSKTDTNKYYIFVAQVHSTIAAARPDVTSAEGIAALATAVEGGQVYLMTVSDWAKVYN